MRKLLLCVAFALASSRAEATTIVFTDRDAFLAASQGADITLTFNEPTLCVPGGFDPQFFCVADYGWVQVMYDIAAVGPGPAPTFIPVHLLSAFVDLTDPTMGFGFEVTASANTTLNLGISSTIGTYSTSMLVSSGTSFLGILSPDGTQFTGFQVAPSTATVGIDNMVVQVPESSSTLGMLFIAIASLGIVSARRSWPHMI